MQTLDWHPFNCSHILFTCLMVGPEITEAFMQPAPQWCQKPWCKHCKDTELQLVAVGEGHRAVVNSLGQGHK